MLPYHMKALIEIMLYELLLGYINNLEKLASKIFMFDLNSDKDSIGS